MLKNLQLTIAIILGMAAMTGGVFTATHYFATAAEHRILCQRVSGLDLSWQLKEYQARIWRYEKQYGCLGEANCLSILPPHALAEYRILTEKRRKLEKQIDRLGGVD